MTNAETLSYLPQETLLKWLLALSIASENTILPNLRLELGEMAEDINEALELKQLSHYKGYEETKTPLGI